MLFGRVCLREESKQAAPTANEASSSPPLLGPNSAHHVRLVSLVRTRVDFLLPLDGGLTGGGKCSKISNCTHMRGLKDRPPLLLLLLRRLSHDCEGWDRSREAWPGKKC